MKLKTYKDHSISVNSGGTGLGSFIQPVCSCGWVGRIHEASNDYQHSNFDENIDEHFTQVKREEYAKEHRNT